MILLYHGVTRKKYNHINSRHITVDCFKEHLIYYKKYFNIVSLKDIFTAYRNHSTFDRPTLAITFDDGYESVLLNALPLLKKYKIPASIFITTMCLENSQTILWPDLLDLFVHFSGLNSFQYSDEKFVRNENTFINDQNDIRDFIKELKFTRKEEIVQLIQKEMLSSKMKTVINEEFYQLLNIDQIKEITQYDFFEVGSHAYHHYNLDKISLAEAKKELLISKRLLEETVQKEVASFAFPHGYYNNDIKELAQNVGYKNLLAVDYCCNDDANDLRILPRFNINSNLSNKSIFFLMNYYFNKKGF